MDENNFEAIDLGEAVAHDFSMWGLFIQADIVVKLVMMSLVFLSFWCWVIIFQKKKFLKRLFFRANKFEEAFWSGEALDKIYSRVKKNRKDPMISTFIAGMEEWQSGISSGVPGTESLRASLKQRVERSMSVAISKEMHQMEKGMTFLASVGSTAPFIGLFGTVWGIMNSFSSIAMSNNTNIAVVAPGIAEALFATALGLVAAIPAVLAYNIFTTSINRYGDRLETFMSEFAAILSRHLDQQSLNDDKPKTIKSSINGAD